MKDPNRIELAVYGKGGIGKSTVSANLSAALADSGRHVLQIGCDPKHDSVRLLMRGENIPTVLEYLKTADKETADPAAVLRTGYGAVGCVETGGPKPGVGCAGRGIISGFEFLDKHHVKDRYDTVVYDVLGDVVCGGFAVPVRREYADAIFLVTSGEYMAIYAANNILRGIYSYDGDTERRVAGIIYNERRLPDEDARVQRFAKAVGLPILVKVPRSEAFAKAEMLHVTLAETEGFEEEKAVFARLAALIRPDMPLYHARPLTDEALEAAVLLNGPAEAPSTAVQNNACAGCENHSVQKAAAPEEEAKPQRALPAKNRLPLYGCAFNGATTAGIHLTDALVLAHAPRACAFYTWQNISSPGRKNLFNRGILMPSSISPHFECTDIGQSEAVFGGMEKLRSHVQRAVEKKPGAVVVISSCVSGIIGDDLAAVEALSTPETPVITIPADGDIAGDYMQGIRMCTRILGEKLIDKTVQPSGRRVNFINETQVSVNHETDYQVMKRLLEQMGVSIHCRFLGDTTVQELRDLKAAPLNILATDSEDGRALQQWLQEEYGCVFAQNHFPVGVQQTCDFLREIGEFFRCTELVPSIIETEQQRYRQELERLRPALQGKKLVITTINANIDYLLQTAEDLGMEILRIGVLNYLHTELSVTSHPDKYSIVENISWEQMYEQLSGMEPDIAVSNYTPPLKSQNCISDVMPMTPVAGFSAGVTIVSRWAELLKKKREGGWMNDRACFEKYNA